MNTVYKITILFNKENFIIYFKLGIYNEYP